MLPLVAVLAAPTLAGCSNDSDKLVIYNAQHAELIEPIAKDFTEKTGIEVEVRNGSDLEMANQLVAEGDASPADVFLTENSPAMSLVRARVSSSRWSRRPSTTSRLGIGRTTAAGPASPHVRP